ncbi:MAG: DUF4881 domain-containing protein [Syntrophobacteraceae bacterium]
MARYYRFIITMLLILPLGFLAGCEYGKVDQGRVVKLDKEKGIVTLIRDVANDSQNPDYTHLPPMIYTLPSDPAEMGPEPKAGQRMKLDTKKHEITIFDPVSQNFKTIAYTLIDQKENVAKTDPSVYDDSQGKPKKFPAVNKEKKTITIYSERQHILTTFSLPDEAFSLPESTWDAGDEARIYFKEAGKALRFMNVSKTDIYKK